MAKDMPDLGLDAPAGEKLDFIDPIFSAPIGPASIVVAQPKVEGRKPMAPEVGLTPEQEKYAAGAAGAVVGPAVQRMAEKAIPSEAARTAAGIKDLTEQQKLQRLLRNMHEEELLRAGLKPIDLTGEASSGAKWMRNWAGIDRPITGGVPEASAAYQRMKGQGPVTSKMTQRWGPTPVGEPGKPKEPLVDRLLRQGTEAEQAVARQATAAEQAGLAAQARLAEAIPGPLAAMGRAFRSPVVQGPLAGAAAGMSFYEAYQRFLEGDRSGAVIDALGGAGAIMTMIPGLQLPGLGLALGSIPAQTINQGLKNPESRRGINEIQVDQLGNPVGP